jgi:hypothetical protein
MHPPRLRNALGALATVLVLTAVAHAQPSHDRLEPGVLAPMDEPDYGVVAWETRLEPGVLTFSISELESGLVGQGDPLFRRGPFTATCRGRCPDVLEPGVLGPHNELESGLIGQGDPIFR